MTTGGAVAVESWTPDYGSAQKTAPPPRIEQSPPFLLMAHPNRWHVRGGKLLPHLSRLALVDGSGQVRKRNGKLYAREAIASYEEKGWTVIPADIDGPGTSYVRKVAGVNAYITRWMQVFSGSDAVLVDADGEAKWLQGLVAKGVIPPCPDYVLDRLAASIREGLLAAQDLAKTEPSAAAKVERLQADLAVILAEQRKRGDAKPAGPAAASDAVDPLDVEEE